MSNAGKTLRVGLIGTGEMARFYARLLRSQVPGVVLTSVSSQSSDRAREFGGELDVAHRHGEHAAIFADSLDAVVIASASDTHAPLIEHAAQAGVATFCDKPLGITPEEIERVLRAAESAGIRLVTGFNRRFDPAYQRVRRMVRDGSLGTPEAVLIIARDPGVPSPAELAAPNRLFIGTTIHDLDMARFLMRDEIVSLAAQGSWLTTEAPASEQVDVSSISLRFRRGGIGTIVNSWRSRDGYDQRAELYGSERVGRVENVSEVHPEVPADAAFFVQRYGASYVAELQAFFTGVQTGVWSADLATGTDGLVASRLAEAAATSWRTGTTVSV